jgi:hypothetical protein
MPSVDFDFEKGRKEYEKACMEFKSIGLDKRACNCLISENICSLGHLVSVRDIDLLKIPNLGKKTLKKIKKALDKHELVPGSQTMVTLIYMVNEALELHGYSLAAAEDVAVRLQDDPVFLERLIKKLQKLREGSP